MSKTFRYHCISDAGKLHNVNEDRWLAVPDAGLFAVTDGMANEVAPEAVVKLLPGFIQELMASRNLQDEDLEQNWAAGLNEINKQVRAEMEKVGDLGLGATLVMAIVKEDSVVLCHIGDSRIYSYRRGKLEQLTRDHSVIESLVDQGTITREQAKESSTNGGPTQFLGMANPVKPGFRPLQVEPKDRLLLCSDGLTEMLKDEIIQEILGKSPDHEQNCWDLVEAANHAGGVDNITAMILAF